MVLTIKILTTDDRRLWREERLAALAEAPYAFGSRPADWQGEVDREERWRQRLGLVGAYNLIAMPPFGTDIGCMSINARGTPIWVIGVL